MRKPFKYIALWEYYYDCPTCDGTGTCEDLSFYNRIKDVFEEVKEHFGQRELVSLYFIDGKPLNTPEYKYGFHRVIEVTWKYKKLHFRLIDSGKGYKVWLQDNGVVKSLYDK